MRDGGVGRILAAFAQAKRGLVLALGRHTALARVDWILASALKNGTSDDDDGEGAPALLSRALAAPPEASTLEAPARPTEARVADLGVALFRRPDGRTFRGADAQAAARAYARAATDALEDRG